MAPDGAAAQRYDRIGVGYAARRREEPTWREAIAAALAGAIRVVNVGAGTGNYEPRGAVVAVEPAATMLEQRREGAAPAVQGVAEHLPFGDGTFDAALAVLTTHHWHDPALGLAELRRVATRQVVVSFDRAATNAFWLLRDYLPELRVRVDAQSAVDDVVAALEAPTVRTLMVPRHCADRFLGAMWDDPLAYLDPAARAAMSGLSLLDDDVVARAMAELERDVDDGTWRRRNAELATLAELDVGFRLVVGGQRPRAQTSRPTT